MRIKSLLGIAVASAAFAPSLQSIPAWADGPKSAYGDGTADPSLDPGEDSMTADEENKARLEDLGNAYHNGYLARAKEDAETYASLRNQLKHPPKQVQSHDVPPLPPGIPDGDEALQAPVPQPRVAQSPLTDQPRYQAVVQQPQYAPPPARYQPTPVYAQAPVYNNGPSAYPQPVYVQQAYAAPPPAVQYVPVYTQEEDAQEYPYPVQAVVQPVVAVASPISYPAYRAGYWAPPFPRPYRQGPMIYQVLQ
jgi:hypothetical protein